MQENNNTSRKKKNRNTVYEKNSREKRSNHERPGNVVQRRGLDSCEVSAAAVETIWGEKLDKQDITIGEGGK